MDSPLAEVIQNYRKLASSLLDEWRPHATRVASKLDAGSYDADDAAADLGVCATLAAESSLRLAMEAWDSLAILTGRQPGRHMVDSDQFSTSLPGAALTLAGPLANGFEFTLPPEVVSIHTFARTPAKTHFMLRADATGRPAGTYLGTVDASIPGAQDSVHVWITVP